MSLRHALMVHSQAGWPCGAVNDSSGSRLPSQITLSARMPFLLRPNAPSFDLGPGGPRLGPCAELGFRPCVDGARSRLSDARVPPPRDGAIPRRTTGASQPASPLSPGRLVRSPLPLWHLLMRCTDLIRAVATGADGAVYACTSYATRPPRCHVPLTSDAVVCDGHAPTDTRPPHHGREAADLPRDPGRGNSAQ